MMGEFEKFGAHHWQSWPSPFSEKPKLTKPFLQPWAAEHWPWRLRSWSGTPQ